MKDLVKRILVFFLAWTLCWGPTTFVIYALGRDGGFLSEAADTEEFAGEIEHTDTPDDEGKSPETVDSDRESTEESVANESDDRTERTETDESDLISTEASAGDGNDGQILDESGENPVDGSTDGSTEDDGTKGEPVGIEKRMMEVDDEDTVYTEEELYDWCWEHRESGGQVNLGGNITISEGISISNIGNPIVINTGQYGLVYDGGCIILMGGYEIIGDGVDVPVVDIQTVIQYGYHWESGWNDVLQEMFVTASGRGGKGGIAVRIRQDDGYFPRFSYYTHEGLIRSYGTGAIGLYLDDYHDALCLQIEVDGSGSTAVYAPQGSNLYYCKLTSRGAGALVASGSENIVVDTCAASPKPQDVEVVNYSFAGICGNRLYYPVRQHSSVDIGDFIDYITFLLRAGKGYPSVAQVFSTRWQQEPIDTSVLGQIKIKGNLTAPFQGLGLEDNFPLEFIVDIRDPNIPCISNIRFNDDSEGTFLSLSFWETYEQEDENVILWRSDDGGVSWYQITASPDIEWFGSGLYYYYGNISSTMMLQIEDLSAGKSNVVSVYPFDFKVGGGHGGDRDGGDRQIVVDPDNEGNTDVEDPTEAEETSAGETSAAETSAAETSSANESSSDSTSSTSSVKSYGDSDSSSGRNSFLKSTSPGNDIEITDAAVPAAAMQNPNNLLTGSEPTQTQKALSETAATVAPKEWENGSTIAISGSRLAAIIAANPQAVTFIKNGIHISVPSGDLSKLGLGENQLFQVEIKKLTGRSFSVIFKADGIELSDLPFTTFLGETVFDGISPAMVVCIDENGNVLLSEYDSATGKLSIFMTGSGVFTLQERDAFEPTAVPAQDDIEVPEQEERQSKEASLNVGAIVIGASIIFLLSGVLVWRKKTFARR